MMSGAKFTPATCVSTQEAIPVIQEQSPHQPLVCPSTYCAGLEWLPSYLIPALCLAASIVLHNACVRVQAAATFSYVLHGCCPSPLLCKH